MIDPFVTHVTRGRLFFQLGQLARESFACDASARICPDSFLILTAEGMPRVLLARLDKTLEDGVRSLQGDQEAGEHPRVCHGRPFVAGIAGGLSRLSATAQTNKQDD